MKDEKGMNKNKTAYKYFRYPIDFLIEMKNNGDIKSNECYI